MTEIRSTRNGKTARVSKRLAKALVAGGKYEYLTREMRPAPPSAPIVQPAVVAERPAAPEVEISPITGKPKRQYRRRAAQSQEEE